MLNLIRRVANYFATPTASTPKSNRVRPTVESLEGRETPSSSLASAIMAHGARYYGPAMYNDQFWMNDLNRQMAGQPSRYTLASGFNLNAIRRQLRTLSARNQLLEQYRSQGIAIPTITPLTALSQAGLARFMR